MQSAIAVGLSDRKNRQSLKPALALSVLLLSGALALGQGVSPMLLSEAVSKGLNNYQSIKARANYVKASEALVSNAKNQYLPDVTASLQQDYGTVNGIFGPATGLGGGVGVASSGPSYGKQSWNAGFGSV